MLFTLMLGVVLALSGAVGSSVGAQSQGNVEYFPETGHTVSGEFLGKYFSTSNFELLYGLPITEAFLDPRTGRQVQYFERARFELYPEQPPELRVRLTPLGEFLRTEGQPANIAQPTAACQTFTETNHTACYAFLDFYHANGGSVSFGYPVSELQYHEGRLVQYFHFARFEWHPERQAGERVRLTNLGERYFEARQENPVLLYAQPAQFDFIAQQPVIQLQVHAFVEKTVTPQVGQQTVYVIVQDQNLSPVQDAVIYLTVTYPNGQTREISLNPSNELGFSKFSFPYDAGRPGRVYITVNASYGSLRQQVLTSFQIW